MRVSLSLFGLALVLLSGCASFRDGANPPITAWPPQGSPKTKTIALQVSGHAIVNDEQKDVNVNFLEVWRTETIRAYESSGLFAAVKSGTDPADLYADVKITDKGEISIGMAVLTGLTLYLIPSKAHECFTVKTTYKDKNGTVVGSADKSECFDFWQQLFLLPAMFSNFPSTVAKEILVDLNRNTILESRAKGVF